MNSQSFAPAAIIGGLHYAGETSKDYPQEKSTYYKDKGQSGRIQSMTYEGNKLLKEMQARQQGLSPRERARLTRQKSLNVRQTASGKHPPGPATENMKGKRVKF